MRNIIRTFLVVVCLLGVIATPVRAGDVLGPGDIAIIGYRFGSNAEFSFVCLRTITAGTEIVFTDNGWTENQAFRLREGFLSWSAPSGGCEIGHIVNVVVGNYSTGMNLELLGDQLIAYQGNATMPNFIFALNSYGVGWQTEVKDNQSSTQPTILANLNPSPSIALGQTAYAVYWDQERSFTSTSVALAYLTDTSHWKTSSSPIPMPTGDFSFTTTAVEVSEFSAETGGETTPWFVIVGLVVIPVLVMVWKKPKRNCCQ